MVKDKTLIPFINHRSSSWFLFYLYLYFILLSLSIIITNKSLYFIKSQLGWTHHRINSSKWALIELIRQLILTIHHKITNLMRFLTTCETMTTPLVIIIKNLTNTNTELKKKIAWKMFSLKYDTGKKCWHPLWPSQSKILKSLS